MAGQARRGTPGRGRSSRAASWPVLAVASAAASGSDTAITSPVSTPASSPDSTPEVATKATYRSLLIRGLAPDEAADLTAWLAGIGLSGSHWTLRQVNQLLFLREMNRSGRFTEANDRIH